MLSFNVMTGLILNAWVTNVTYVINVTNVMDVTNFTNATKVAIVAKVANGATVTSDDEDMSQNYAVLCILSYTHDNWYS